MSGIDAPSIPPLQAFSWLSTQVFNCATPNAAQAALRMLGDYLQTQSCNLGEVEALRQWNHQKNREDISFKASGVDLDVLERVVASRANEVRTVLVQNKEKAAIMIGGASTGSAAARVGASQNGSRGLTTSVVEWWRVGADSPWSFALNTRSEGETPSASTGYPFFCLGDTLELVEPFLNEMRCAAALGAGDAVSTAFMEGTSFTLNGVVRKEPAYVFAALELARTYVTLSFGDCAGLAAVAKAMQASRALDNLRCVATLLEHLDAKDVDAQDSPQPQSTSDQPAGTLTKTQAYWKLAVSFAVFFHTVAAYLDGVSGDFEKFASAVLGTGGRPGLHLWGAASFPFLPFTATGSNAAAAHRGDAARAASGAQTMVRTRLATLFPSSTSHVSGGATDYYLAEYRALITDVIAPASTFSTLLILSAVATLPLQVVMQQLPVWVELRELYEECNELKSLLCALHDGRLGTVWLSASAAAARYLAHTPHLQAAVVQELLQGVKKALCFHYISTRDVTNMAQAAQDLSFDATEEFVGIVTDIIRDQYIDARIDLMTGTVRVQATDSLVEGREDMGEAVGRAVLGLSTLEMQLTCLSAERNLIFVPAGQDE